MDVCQYVCNVCELMIMYDDRVTVKAGTQYDATRKHNTTLEYDKSIDDALCYVDLN